MPFEIAPAKERLALEKERAQHLAALKTAIEATQEVDMTSVDSIREAKQALEAQIQVARQAGLPNIALREAEARRRRLHNAIEDIKGSIRVFCRVRPLSKREKDLGDTEVTKALDSMTLAVEASAMSFNHDDAQFSFDAVFTPGTQEEVFADCADLVQSALDGYNVTIFAYGQTGAGKTFTMYGAPGNEGTAPRTIGELFRLIERDSERMNITVMASMMELYRNELVDLLLEKPSERKKPALARSQTMALDGALKKDALPKLNVHTDPRSGHVHIEHLTEVHVTTAEGLLKVLEQGNKQRTVAATAMNSESSRSHLVLIIQIVCVNRETHEQTRGKIILVDLAGSERLKKSEVTGDMQKEAIEINKSLTALGDVIEALTKGAQHVPYKNHKLTLVMSDALGGSSKTLMFVNCSPASSNLDETTMSLKYATRAKSITKEVKKNVVKK